MTARRPLSYAIVGTGALGGFYGVRLAAAGRDVRFVLRSDYAHVRQRGLRLESPAGDVALARVAAFRDPSEVPACDVACLCVKTTENGRLRELLSPLIRRGAAVLVLQNGLGVEEDVLEACPGAVVLGGLCFLCSNKVGPGRIRHLGYGAVTLGARDARGRRLVARVAADLRAAGVEAVIDPDLEAARWRKLVWNIPFNGLAAVLGADTGELMGDPAAHALVRCLMDEVCAAARGCGHGLEEDAADRMLALTDRMPAYRPSMALDLDAGRPLEIEHLYGRPCGRARDAGIPMPRAEALRDLLRFLDRRARTRRIGAGHMENRSPR